MRGSPHPSRPAAVWTRPRLAVSQPPITDSAPARQPFPVRLRRGSQFRAAPTHPAPASPLIRHSSLQPAALTPALAVPGPAGRRGAAQPSPLSRSLGATIGGRPQMAAAVSFSRRRPVPAAHTGRCRQQHSACTRPQTLARRAFADWQPASAELSGAGPETGWAGPNSEQRSAVPRPFIADRRPASRRSRAAAAALVSRPMLHWRRSDVIRPATASSRTA